MWLTNLFVMFTRLPAYLLNIYNSTNLPNMYLFTYSFIYLFIYLYIYLHIYLYTQLHILHTTQYVHLKT
jgi:hypothetical protein